jgi:hypothetical protein
MTGQDELLRRVTQLLEQAGIAYMISGSVASSFHGHPRATNDTDIVIDPSSEQLTVFVDSLGTDFYVSREAAIQALDHRTMFNVIDLSSGNKADLIIRKDRPFSEQEFARRLRANFGGADVFVLSPEDSILSKLEWSQGRQSDIQLRDAQNILLVQKETLDFDYLRKWAKELGIEDSLNRLMNC